MKNDEEISIITTDNTSTLIIKSFDAEKHIGEIICKAENDAGEVSCTASMAVSFSFLLIFKSPRCHLILLVKMISGTGKVIKYQISGLHFRYVLGIGI